MLFKEWINEDSKGVFYDPATAEPAARLSPAQSWQPQHLRRDITSTDQGRMNVGFTSQDVRSFKEALRDYRGITKQYLNMLAKKFPNVQKLYDRHMISPKNQINIASMWADKLLAQAADSRYQGSNNRVKVGRREFEEAKKVIRDYIVGIDQFQKELIRLAPPKYTQRLNDVYQQNVIGRRTNLIKTYQWLDQKINELLRSHGRI